MQKKNSYLNLNYKPDYNNEIVATFYGESKASLKEMAQQVAGESSIGTWTKLTTLSDKVFEKLAARIFYLNEKTRIFKIAYPLSLFEPKSIPQLLSSIAGNIFSMKTVKNLRLNDIEFPKKYIRQFDGPRWGIAGIRKTLNIRNRPIIGCIMKPKLGLTSTQNANLAAEIFKNGVDLIKDDENLTSLTFNKFEDRVRKVLVLKKQVEKETGRKKIYVFNVTAPADVMVKRAKLVKKLGGRCIMVDVISAGWAAVQELRSQNLDLIIHGHRAGHSTFTRNKKHGISMLVLANLCRLAGIDQLHTGTVVGKMEGGAKEVCQINDLLKEDWGSIKPVLPIASGGLHPGLIPKLVKILGRDLVVNFGGGLHGHPQGVAAGAKAAVQSVEATIQGVPLNVYARNHKELSVALEHWKS
ncbi:type III ribulose-bisphosphate carboxylase [Candidatus Parcubacteria bacterium 4484_255]|nr:MAG: type III ribulose-bisphosphate carboxylase [Candidatus Parcubacteria bacterium 4484_255]